MNKIKNFNSPVPAALICPLRQISRGKLFIVLIILLLTAICHLPSVFAALKDNLSESYIYPNPVRISLGHDKVTFENLTNNVIIKVFKASGDLVREINATDTTGTVIWDLTNDNGAKVASGIYLYLITNDTNQKFKGKLAIIR